MSASPLRAALYLRVSTPRQAEHDVSIPDQRKQGEAYCATRGYQLVETYVEPGASATNDRRPEFQRMMEAGTTKPAAFDVVIVHSFSRFFRDHFELEFYVRKLAKNGVKLVSMTQELGDDPMHVMMRQIMALFDEYQSKENAKHTLRALKENARQGFWNGSLPPIGYRVVDAEKRGAKVKKKLEIDPLHADTVRLAFRLALEGDGTSGRMGVKAIAKHLNQRDLYTRTGGRWGVGAVHRMLTRPTYIGRHEFNKRSKAKTLGRGPGADRSGDVRCRASAPEVAQPDGDAGAGRQRPDAADRHLLLRRLRRGHDAAHVGQGRAVPLLHLLDRRPAGRDGLQGPLGSDAQARRPRGLSP
jgi:DNA invertase Pin-like site-specific DNA recombinase